MVLGAMFNRVIDEVFSSIATAVEPITTNAKTRRKRNNKELWWRTKKNTRNFLFQDAMMYSLSFEADFRLITIVLHDSKHRGHWCCLSKHSSSRNEILRTKQNKKKKLVKGTIGMVSKRKEEEKKAKKRTLIEEEERERMRRRASRINNSYCCCFEQTLTCFPRSSFAFTPRTKLIASIKFDLPINKDKREENVQLREKEEEKEKRRRHDSLS